VSVGELELRAAHGNRSALWVERDDRGPGEREDLSGSPVADADVFVLDADGVLRGQRCADRESSQLANAR
jgi:hypothetical protein